MKEHEFIKKKIEHLKYIIKIDFLTIFCIFGILFLFLEINKFIGVLGKISIVILSSIFILLVLIYFINLSRHLSNIKKLYKKYFHLVGERTYKDKLYE